MDRVIYFIFLMFRERFGRLCFLNVIVGSARKTRYEWLLLYAQLVGKWTLVQTVFRTLWTYNLILQPSTTGVRRVVNVNYQFAC